MKKKLLLLTTFLIATIAIIGVFNTKNPVKAVCASPSNELISYKITVPSNYYNGKKISSMVLHYGVNGWNNPKDVDMYVSTGNYSHGIPSTYNFNAIVKVRKGDTIDYCIKTITDGGVTSWNNNNGRNFSIVANESNVETIQYEIDWLAEENGIFVDSNSDVTLHYGTNGWNNPTDVKMELKDSYEYGGKQYTWYKAIVTVEEGTTINYCVKATTPNGIKWDNNNNSDYSVVANQSYIQ